MTRLLLASLLLASSPLFGFPFSGALAQPRPTPPPAAPAGPSERIVAVVNGDIITTGDVANRGRLFALSTGLPVTPDVLNRLRPQVARQLVDERLRLQEIQRRKISVSDREIADAIAEIEGRNNMPKGALTSSLQGQGVAARTLIDQVRVQLGWTRLLRQELGSRAEISDADIAEQARIFKESIGRPEFNVGEIFIPVDDPAKAADAQRFADTVIAQLRAGAPFPVVAAQFSQSQTALQGGSLGWVRASQLDPEVAAIVTQMPPGAISNPVPVAGGLMIVTMRGKREVGRDQATVLSIRQVFVPFTQPLNPQAPNDQQKRALEQATGVSRTAKTCKDMEEANARFGNARPTDPGEVRLETIASAPLRSLLGGLAPGQPSKPVVASEGVAVIMLCGRDQKAEAAPSKEEVSNRLLSERIELTSRQLQRELRRRATLDERA